MSVLKKNKSGLNYDVVTFWFFWVTLGQNLHYFNMSCKSLCKSQLSLRSLNDLDWYFTYFGWYFYLFSLQHLNICIRNAWVCQAPLVWFMNQIYQLRDLLWGRYDLCFITLLNVSYSALKNISQIFADDESSQSAYWLRCLLAYFAQSLFGFLIISITASLHLKRRLVLHK